MKHKVIDIEPVEIRDETAQEIILRALKENPKGLVISQFVPLLDVSVETIRVFLIRMDRLGEVTHRKQLVKQKGHAQFRNMTVWKLA